MKKVGVASLKKKADTCWSTYVRMRDADMNGIASCISCGVKKPWKQLQNGHFVSRSSSTLRFDDENCNAQCVGCNMFKQGNQFAYGKALDMKYGDGTAEKLWSQRMDTHKWTITELEEVISDAKEAIKFYEQN